MLNHSLKDLFTDEQYEHSLSATRVKALYRLIIVLLFLLLVLLPNAWAGFSITTVAGSNTRGYSDSNEGNPAVTALLAYPHDVVVDKEGNLYIADTYNHRVRKVNTQGIITTVAGDGNEGYGGDGGPAIAAKFNNPEGLAIDSKGNLYIADRDNHRIRKVDTRGIVTTVAGNGNEGYSGDEGFAVAAKLNDPTGIAIDNTGNVYIADMDNHRIRKIDSDGVITTVVGNGNARYSGDGELATVAELNSPHDVTIDKEGNFYITDTRNHRIRKVNVNSIITTIAGNGNEGYSGDEGPAIAAKLNDPESIVVDSKGNLYIADMDNHRIRQINNTLGVIRTVAGDGHEGYSEGDSAITSALNDPEGIGIDGKDNLYIADTQNHRIRKLAITGPDIRIEQTTLIF
jgi:sugar lactone lactonase YvrE